MKFVRFLMVVATLIGAGVSAEGENLIKDGKFKSGRLTGEVFQNTSPGHAKVNVIEDSEVGYCAKVELIKFLRDKNGRKRVNVAFCLGGQPRKGGFPVEPNTNYKLSVKLKGSARAEVRATECLGTIRWKDTMDLPLAPRATPRIRRDKWTRIEKTFTTSGKARSAVVIVKMWWDEKYGPMSEKYTIGDYVLIRDVKVEKLPKTQHSAMKKNCRYYWREIEDVFQGRRFKTSKWTPIGSTLTYSGKGAGGMAASSAVWRTNIQEMIDQQSLMPKPITYYMWMRVYGHRSASPVTVTYDSGPRDRGTVGEFKIKPTEKVNADGEYLAPGKFYWQLVGSFTTKGGMTTFTLEAADRFFGDALLITDDPEYRPRGFDARKAAARRVNSFNVLKDSETIYIDPSYLTFGATDQFITPLNFWIHAQSGAKIIRPVDKPAYVYIALPEWLEALGVVSHWATQWGRDGTTKKHVLENLGPETIDGAKYRVYRSNTFKLISFFRFFVKGISTKIKYGSMSKAYVWLVDGKTVTGKRSMNLIAVKVKSAPQFRKIFIGPMGAAMTKFFKAYPTLPETLQFCGVNMLNTWNSERAPRQGEVAFSKEFIRRCNERNIAVIDEMSPGYKYWSVKPQYAVKSDGKKAARCLALSMDGSSPYIKEFQAAIRRIVEAGHSGMTIDDEVYNHDYDAVDFSDEFIALFKQHLADTKPGLRFVEPTIFVKDQKKYPKLYKAWMDFRCSRVTNWYRLYREAFDAAMKKYHPDSTFGKTYFIPVIVNFHTAEDAKRHLFDLQAMMPYCTHISPMIYTFHGIPYSGYIGTSIKRLKRILNTDRDVAAPTLLGGHRDFGEIPQNHIRMVKYQIYECLINKAPGMFFWYTCGFMNPQVLNQVSTALNATVRYERFFTDGKVIQAEVDSKNARVDVLELDGRYMIYVTAYSRGEQSMKVTVRLPGAKFTEALDVESGKKFPVMNHTVKIRFDKEYGRMVLLK